jgi:hypothetical protein
MSGMTESHHDPFEAALAALRQPAPPVPGLVERTRQRATRLRHRRAWLTGTTGVVGAALLTVVLVRPELPRPSGTTFALVAPSSASVSLVGDFNDWDTDETHLKRTGDDEWTVTLELPPGRYRFAYVTDDGTWLADPKAAPTVDEFGEPTSVVTVPSE